ncbi:MAG: hypothetical protein QGF68_04505 [Nitrospinota bacterium]|nr:hypothetical protein [Nitrospinota bacterium]
MGHGVDGVDDQVDQGLPQIRGISLNHWFIGKVLCNLDGQAAVFGLFFPFCAGDVFGVRNDLVEIEKDEIGVILQPAKVLNPSDRRGSVQGRGLNRPKGLGDNIDLRLNLDMFNRSQNEQQRVVHIVGDSGGKLAENLQPLDLKKLLFDLFTLRQISKDAEGGDPVPVEDGS